MFDFFQRWRERRILRQSTISPAQWQEAFAALPVLSGLSLAEQQQLRELATLFLHDKAINGAQGFVVDESMALLIVLQACLPILYLGLGCYRDWSEVIVYPSGFAPTRTYTDAAGVVHRERSNLSGESWQRGPVILAGDATAQAGIIDGHNLVIHEFAHKLDMQNGVANGFPPLHVGMRTDTWSEVFSAGFADLQKRCHHHKHIGIDCYAATSPAEFFAVLSEVFFERPAVIRQHYTAIYDLLQQYYRQDPLVRLP